MDLRSIINNEGVEASRQKQVENVSSNRAGLHGSYPHEYSQRSPPTLNTHKSQDSAIYGQTQFSSPTTQHPSFQARSSQPPHSTLQLQSSGPNPQSHAQSPYRQPHIAGGGAQYPFPPAVTPQSPAQPHQYVNIPQRQDSYGHSTQPLSYSQYPTPYEQPSPAPQTPTAASGAPGYPGLQHQRSLSSHSISTPTSTHSQAPYQNHYLHDSPVSVHAYPPTQPSQPHRQPSQPGTPLGPPATFHRQSSANYPQPMSPYQQRLALQHQQSSLASQPQPMTASRLSNTPSIPETHKRSIDMQTRSSYSDRERSLSVSPKTRVPSLPQGEMVPPKVEIGGLQQAKRKLDDHEQTESLTPAALNNGKAPPDAASPISSQPVKKRVRYSEPPIWARSITGRVKKGNPLLPTKKPVNGAQIIRTPVAATAVTNGHAQTLIADTTMQQTEIDPILGPWEPSITGERPHEEITKAVTDWLYYNVVNRPDAGELASRGVEVEIEAKLGQLIDQDVNQRVQLPVQSECLLTDRSRVTFRSSMTEMQHKALNQFLNSKVQETHPGNPEKLKPRVPIVYTHRRERDSFYELTPAAIAALPASIRNEVNKRHTVKVRLTHDQRTGQELARIIKARVADLNIYNPRFPLDCRISVNLEMRYDGDVGAQSVPVDGVRIPDRNKDRLSYKQAAYQIDLTQVTTADATSKGGKEHELEIELNAASVREQGLLAQSGQPHKYMELVEGLINNVRVLTRAVPFDNGG